MSLKIIPNNYSLMIASLKFKMPGVVVNKVMCFTKKEKK